MPGTIVFFHAHPDDEALLTAGTMARAAREGHRVVLVVATAGEGGEVSPDFLAGSDLGLRRRAELDRSARELGVARTVVLGYGDSGLHGDAPGATFVATPVDAAAERLAAVLREEAADVLTTYDPAGGYGHPDHVRVHHVGARAAELAGTPAVLEATVDRDLLLPVLRVLRAARLFPAGLFDQFRRAYSARVDITHRIDVRAQAPAKRAAMAAHASQATPGDQGGDRTLAAFLRLPRPLFQVAFGREWYVQRGAPRPSRPYTDVFATVPG